MMALQFQEAHMKIAKNVQNLPQSYIREILKAATAPGCLSLAGGLPAQEHFPMERLTKIFSDIPDKPELFQYGETRGYPALIDFLENARSTPKDHSTLITNGSQQALDLIARTFIDGGDIVALEAPSYLGALQVFSLCQASISCVNQTPTGPDCDQLESLFATQKVKIFYAVPDFHNPTGVCWNLDTRQKVAQLCQHYGVLLIEDMPYRELRFSGQTLPSVSSLCPDHSLSTASFSKVAAPGMRLGYVQGKSEWINALIRVKQASDLHTNLPLQYGILALIEHPDFATHLTRARSAYQAKYQHLTALLDREIPELGQYTQVDGGMFLWFELQHGDDTSIAQHALDNGIAVVPSHVFYPGEFSAPAALRLNFSHCAITDMPEAVTRLRKAITQG